MPRQTRKTINAKQNKLAEIVAKHPNLTIAEANLALYDHFEYKLTPSRASPVVKAARVATAAVQNEIRNALGLGI